MDRFEAATRRQMSRQPDGNLWFSELGGDKIGRITASGVVTEFALPTPLAGPQGITSGADGALWFAELAGNKIGRVDTAGAVTEFTVPTRASEPDGVVTGPDHAVWFSEF